MKMNRPIETGCPALKPFLARICLLALLTLGGCATPIRSTVDGYGEAPIAASDPLFFDRDSLPLGERPISDSCREAASALGLKVSTEPCAACKRVEVRSRLSGTTQAVSSSGPSFGTSVGFGLGGSTGFGLGVGSNNVRSRAETERVIDIGIFGKGKDLLRTITARSVGPANSVAAVAYEMCYAAFRDYPANLKGKVYEIKPGQSAKE